MATGSRDGVPGPRRRRRPWDFVEFMPAARFRVHYPNRFLGWFFEEHKFLREAFVLAFPRAIRRELATNERVAEIPFAIHALRLPRGARVLDIGSRWSPLPLHLAALGYRTVATDLVPFPFFGGGPEFVCADLTRPPFKPESFDGAVMVSTLEHVGIEVYGGRANPEADIALMRAIRPVLKPEGILVLTVPYGRAGVGPLQRSYDGQRLRRVTDGWILEEERFHVRRGPAWEWTTEAVAASKDSAVQTHAVALLLLRRP
ncbi:MAG TPA: class I SAM-dependent methyltransferase [Thermoplasmata archaeon]|nr:class I SAM-dependent methyltransferase [Thermoplasmata archaeon]